MMFLVADGHVNVQGVKFFKEVRQSEAHDLVNLAFGQKGVITAPTQEGEGEGEGEGELRDLRSLTAAELIRLATVRGASDAEISDCVAGNDSVARLAALSAKLQQPPSAAPMAGSERPDFTKASGRAPGGTKGRGQWPKALQEQTEWVKRLLEAVALKIDSDTAVPLDKSPKHQLVFPDLGSVGKLGQRQSEFILRNQCSHLVLTKSEQLNEALKILTEDLVPHVSVIVSGKRSPRTWNEACAKVATYSRQRKRSFVI
jgi:hypothetical protein